MQQYHHNIRWLLMMYKVEGMMVGQYHSIEYAISVKVLWFY